jgi:3D (Asp-Asp-Asp) domain-containing protein
MPIFGALIGLFALSGAVTAIPASAQAPAAPALPTYSVALTGYNAVPAQTDSNPLVTASGAFSNPEVVAARSQDLADTLPFGTVIEVLGPAAAQKSCGYGVVGDKIGYRVIADTMNKKFTDRLDILFPTAAKNADNRAVILGICDQVTVKVVGHVDLANPANLPKTQADLAALVAGADGVALK